MQFDTTHFEHFIKSLFLMSAKDKKIKFFANPLIYKQEVFEDEEIAQIVEKSKHLNSGIISDNIQDLKSYLQDIDDIILFFSKVETRVSKTSKQVKSKLSDIKGTIQKQIRILEKGRNFREKNIPIIVSDDNIIEYLLNYKHEWLCSMINFDDYSHILTAIKNCYGDKLTKVVREYSCKNSFDYFINFFN